MRAEAARLLLEASQALRVLRVGFGQQLERDLASEARVLREVDLAHPAPAEQGEDFVRAEELSDGQFQLKGFRGSGLARLTSE